MPDFGTSNRVALRQVAEVTWGTIPATPTFEAIRFTSESLNYNADFITSEEIRSDRMTPDTIQVSSQAGGDINGEWSYATYDEFIAAAMYGAWATTATEETAQTDISITKTPGTPNTWTLDSAALADFSDNSFVVGQFIKVGGFTTAGTFYAEVTSIAALSLGINPLTDVASEIAVPRIFECLHSFRDLAHHAPHQLVVRQRRGNAGDPPSSCTAPRPPPVHSCPFH